MGPGVVVDVQKQSAGNPDYQITERDLRNWERQHGMIAPGTILLLRTGFGKFYPDRKKYLGTDKRGADAVPQLHFPGLHPEAAKWLTQNRRIKAIGLDTASIDYGQSTLYESHRALFDKNIPAFENVANLASFPKRLLSDRAAMNIKGGSGRPLRIIAIVAVAKLFWSAVTCHRFVRFATCRRPRVSQFPGSGPRPPPRQKR